MTFSQTISNSLQMPVSKVTAVIDLLDDGNTIPFIARYRKESTGGLDEIQLRQIEEELSTLRALDDRRKTVLNTIREQDKLTPDLERQILQAENRTALEDLYQPYKPKRQTRASSAREKGLTALAEKILDQENTDLTLKQIASPFLSDQVAAGEEAWQGARDIAAENISDHPPVRRGVREKALIHGILTAEKKTSGEDPRQVYRTYYEFKGRVNQLQSHQILALNRAEREGVLKINLSLPEDGWREVIADHFPVKEGSPLAEQLEQAVDDAASRLLLPAIERDIRRKLTEKAEREAIEIFASNLRSLLLRPPLIGHTILGLDPGFRTGCKVAVVDATGKPLSTATIYPVPPRNQKEEAHALLTKLIKTHGVTLIALGNGTASRETEQFVAELISRLGNLQYLIVNEAGASVYSASQLAGEELPEMDVSLRGAVSIARRVQDPLAELVKIDPQSIGVGMYQHDVNQTRLEKKLESVVESVVNQVGVDLNTASPALLTHISGIGPSLAEKIVAYRDSKGPFPGRQELLAVSGLGDKTYQQAAGFLRIIDGTEPLDSTAIHPESYHAAREILRLAGIKVSDPSKSKIRALKKVSQEHSPEDLAARLNTGIPTLKDIFRQLASPGRDPREELPRPNLRSKILTMDDLIPGLEITGTVRNVVAFGAFIDIGVKQEGLLHRSQIPQGTTLAAGEVLQVTILQVDQDRGRISLGWTPG